MSEPVIKAQPCPRCGYRWGNLVDNGWSRCHGCGADTQARFTRDDLVRVAEASRQMAWVQVYNELKSPTIVFEETPSDVVDRLTKGDV